VFDASSSNAYGPGGLQNAAFGYNTTTNQPLINFKHAVDNRLRPIFSGYYNASSAPLYTYCLPNSTNPNCNSAGPGYTANGNVANVIDSANGTWSYSYDTLNRLTRGAATSGPFSGKITCLAYDSWGNRTSESLSTTDCNNNPPAISWAQYNIHNSNQIDNSGPQQIFQTYYDYAGNLNDDGSQFYTFDGEGRLCSSSSSMAGTAVGYIYDAEGNRIGKGTLTHDGCNLATNGFAATLGFVVGLNGEQLTEISGGNSWQHTNLFVKGELFATYKGSDLYFSLNDWLGTRRAEVSGSGCAPATYANLPYGDKLLTAGSCPYTTEHHFTGKERDADGNDYFGARFYSSTLGRFLSPDDGGDQVADDPQSWNLYSYARNNPLSSTDPSGQDCVYINNDTGEFEGLDRGDCDPERSENGYYFNGTIDTLYTSTGDLTGQVTGVSGINDNTHSYTFDANPEGVNPGPSPSTGGFGAGTLGASVFGAQNSGTWINANGVVNAAGTAELTIAGFVSTPAAIAGALAGCNSASGRCAGSLALAAVPIKIGGRGWAHVLDRHVIGGVLSKGKSLFAAGEDVQALIKAAESVTPTASRRYFVRVVDAGRIIGTDRATGTATSMYTVVTDASGELITAHPGLPQ